jgi:hypothetical protein
MARHISWLFRGTGCHVRGPRVSFRDPISQLPTGSISDEAAAKSLESTHERHERPVARKVHVTSYTRGRPHAETSDGKYGRTERQNRSRHGTPEGSHPRVPRRASGARDRANQPTEERAEQRRREQNQQPGLRWALCAEPERGDNRGATKRAWKRTGHRSRTLGGRSLCHSSRAPYSGQGSCCQARRSLPARASAARNGGDGS